MPGGVCAVLDYEVDEMTDYVAEMAVRVVTPESSVSSRFRKFVSQILESTRLPKTTILLGLNYLAKRINTIKANPQVHGPYKASEGETWRYLTVALLLASKFLDDNTFQNRSWSEVTSIPVAELNTLEFEWLAACRWQLYVNLDETQDYQAWLSDWKTWIDNRRNAEKEALAAEQQRNFASQRKPADLPPIQTNFPIRHSNLASPVSAYSSNRGSSYEQQQHRYSKSDYEWNYRPMAPITPPHSGFGTPEHQASAANLRSTGDYFTHNMSSDHYMQYPVCNRGAADYSPDYYCRSSTHPYDHDSCVYDSAYSDECLSCVAVPASSRRGYLSQHMYSHPTLVN